MPINDRKIDLTVDLKFSTRTRRVDSLVSILFEEDKKLKFPWYRGVKTRKRSYGDFTSDNFGDTVRRSSNNKLSVFGSNLENAEKVLKDYIELEGGGFENIVRPCHRCGTLHISRHYEPLCKGCLMNMNEESTKRHLFTIRQNGLLRII